MSIAFRSRARHAEHEPHFEREPELELEDLLPLELQELLLLLDP